MAVIGIDINKENPEFNIHDFTFWLPEFTNFINTEEGQRYFNKIYPMVNDSIFKSIYGNQWELAMSYAIAHYITIIARHAQSSPGGYSLSDIANSGGDTPRGVLSSMSVGSFSKSYELDKTMIDTDEAKFWNQTSYGADLMALLASKPVASIFVVTSGNLDKNRRR